MHWITLPEPESSRSPAFQDPSSAKAWLKEQPRAQPLLMQALLHEQVGAIDAAQMPPALAIELLNILHGAVVPIQANLEVRYTRKALPLLDEEQRIFDATHRLWGRLGIAYLRRAPHFAPQEKCLPLHRAANAFRMAEYCHFQAGRVCPPQLDELLFAVLVQAESSKLLRQPMTDPDFPHLGEANIAGLLAWAFLLRLIDPYRLTAAQLAVANRAISRWRELCTFQPDVDSSPHAQSVPLAIWFACTVPEGTAHWLNIRPVTRKIHARIESLRAGESPESLKLGRELSGSACIRLLTDIERHLQPQTGASATGQGEIQLVFGTEDAYAIFRDELLNPAASMDVQSKSLSNQRMAVFGFDQVSRLQTAVRKLHVPDETWSMLDGQASRLPDGGQRRLSPCLIAARIDGQARLGTLRGLRVDAAGSLQASLDWYAGEIEACSLKHLGLREQKQPRTAIFLLRDGNQLSLILPPNAPIRSGAALALEGSVIEHLLPGDVIDRGIDFVRYACQPC